MLIHFDFLSKHVIFNSACYKIKIQNHGCVEIILLFLNTFKSVLFFQYFLQTVLK